MNRTIQNKRTIRKLLRLIVLAAALLFMPALQAKATGRFTTSVSATRNAVSECYDMLIEVANSGENINATVRFETQLYGAVYAFEEDAALPGGSSKTVKLRIPANFVQNAELNGWSNNKSEIVILSGNRELQREELVDDVFSGRGANTILEGILSDHPNQLSYMDNAGRSLYISGNSKEIKVEKLTSDFTEDDLAELSYLVIDDVDTSVYSAEQISAIEEWTKAGGALIIGTGSRPETLSGFSASFLDASVQETFPGDYGISVINYGNSYVDPQISMDLKLRQIFDGVITILPTSLAEMKDLFADQSEDSSAFFELQMLYDTLADYSGISATVDAYNTPYYVREAFNYLDERINLSFGWLRFVILIYVILIGPILYLVLKSMGQREKIWWILPAVSLSFVLLIMLAGIGNRISGLRMKSVSVAAADGSGNRHTYLTGFHSSNKDWKILLSEDAVAAAPRDDNSYSGNADITIRKDKGQVAAIVDPDGSFRNAAIFALYKNDEKGKLKFEYENDPMIALRIVGTLTNETDHDFPYVIVSKGSYAVIFRDVKSGETVSTKDTPRIEQTITSYDAGDTMRSMASDFYYDKEYQKAAEISALLIGYSDISLENDQQLIVMGVTEDSKQLVEGKQDINQYLCLYGE